MPTYRVTVTVKTREAVTPAELASHACEAVSCWGGQGRPEDPLFSANVRVKAICRGEVMQDHDFNHFRTGGKK